MRDFDGFPARTQFTPVPRAFFSHLLPRIEDIAELKTTLHLFDRLYRKRGYPRYVTYTELENDADLIAGLKQTGESPQQALRRGLDMASHRGTFIRLVLTRDGGPEEAYFLNSEPDRRAVASIRQGELALSGLRAPERPGDPDLESPPNIFALYEENVGMLTPMIADELREAEKLYPEPWISDAIREAVSLNKRSWRYIARILENWATRGRGDQGQRQETTQADRDKYDEQRYGHMFRR